MAIFDNIKKLFKSNKKVQMKQYPTTMFNTVSYTQGKNYSYDDLVKEGYENNAIAYRCINEIANTGTFGGNKIARDNLRFSERLEHAKKLIDNIKHKDNNSLEMK